MGCKLLIAFHGCGGCALNKSAFGKNGGWGPGSAVADNMYARYAESNGIVLMHPCVTPWENGNNVSDTHANAAEIARGCWDGYGQLTEQYALQSGVHMRNVFRMVEHIAGLKNRSPRLDCSASCHDGPCG